MKIIIAHYKYHIQGGPERYMFKFMELARCHGAHIIPFSIDYPANEQTEYSRFFAKSDGSQSGKFEPHNRKLSYLVRGAAREFHNKDAYKKLCSLIEIEKPDVLYCLIPGQLTADIFKAAKKYGVPIILRLSDYRLICGNFLLMRNECVCEECIHGNYKPMIKNRCVHNSKIMSILRYFSLRYFRKKRKYDIVDAVITPPLFTKNKFIESGYFSKDKIYVNPTFIDCTSVQPNYNCSNYILCLGRFSKEKGFKYAIKSMGYLKDIDVKLAITGSENDLDDETRTLIKSMGIENKINFVGFIKGKELENLIDDSIAIACPAIWYENMPNVVLEAYAHGKPVIASKIGSLTELVEDGVTGLTFETKNSIEFAESVKRICLNNEFRVQLGKNARKKCETEYSPEKHWQRFVQIYTNIIKNKTE